MIRKTVNKFFEDAIVGLGWLSGFTYFWFNNPDQRHSIVALFVLVLILVALCAM